MEKIQNQKTIFTKEEQLDICTRYEQSKETLAQIGKIYTVSSTLIRRVLTQNEVPIRSVTSHFKKYKLNHNYFDTIDTEEKAYWLGFIYADGCVYYKRKNQPALGISLAVGDINHLYKFQKVIDFEGQVLTIHRKNMKPHCAINIRSDKMCNALMDKGVIPNKSLVKTFPDNSIVPDKFLYDFIRGYFEGNGGFSHRHKDIPYYVEPHMHLCSTKKFLERIIEIFNLKVKINDRKNINQNIGDINIGGRTQVVKITKLLYHPLATIYLDRKYDMAMNIINHSKENVV